MNTFHESMDESKQKFYWVVDMNVYIDPGPPQGGVGQFTLCPVDVLKAYIAQIQSLMCSHPQSFVCFSAQKLGLLLF